MKINKKEIIKYISIIIIGTAIGLLMIKYGDFGQKVTNSCALTNSNYMTDQLSEYKYAVQTFIPEFDDLRSISLMIDRQADMADQGCVVVTVYDSEGNELGSDQKDIINMKSNKQETYLIDTKVVPGNTYYFSVQAIGIGEVGPALVYRAMPIDRITENISLQYDGAVLENSSTACAYTYVMPVTKMQMIEFVVFGMVLCAVIWNMVEVVKRKRI